MNLSEGDKKILEWFEPYTKYIIIIVLLVVFYMFVNVTYERDQCSNACLDKGYFDYRYVPPGRYRASSCYCYTEEQTNIKNKIIEGTRIDI